MAGLIRDYLDEVGHRLAFDPALRMRAREELSAHLDEALDNDADPDRAAAERRILGRFGRAEEIAAGLIRATRPKRVRQALLLAALLVLQLFLFMRLRAMGASADLIAADPVLAAIVRLDRFAFIAAMAGGLAGALLLTRGAGLLRAGAGLCALALAGLAVSVLAGGFIAGTIAAQGGGGAALILALASPVEALLLVILIVQLRRLLYYARASEGAVSAPGSP